MDYVAHLIVYNLSFHVWVGECHFSKVCWACNSNELVHISSLPRTQEGFFKDLGGQSFLRKTLTFKRWKWMLCLHLANCCQKQLFPTTRQGFLLFHWISFQLLTRDMRESLNRDWSQLLMEMLQNFLKHQVIRRNLSWSRFLILPWLVLVGYPPLQQMAWEFANSFCQCNGVSVGFFRR